jgi:voltage-gated potassium channel
VRLPLPQRRPPWLREDAVAAPLRGRSGEDVRRLRIALVALVAVLAAGTAGYLLLGFGWLDAAYQTVTTVTTVGFGEVKPLSPVGKVFTIGLVLAGVGTALYALGVILEAVVEGHLLEHLEGRRMDRAIARMQDHVIICGWGRVGRSCALHLAAAGLELVVVDRDPARLADVPYPHVVGDVSDDEVMRGAGIAHAHALIAALETDADNVYVALSARALRPDLVIIARARSEESTAKLLRAGADRVVNPQLIGGRRMAAFTMQPHVAEFLDVVVHGVRLVAGRVGARIGHRPRPARRSGHAERIDAGVGSVGKRAVAGRVAAVGADHDGRAHPRRCGAASAAVRGRRHEVSHGA